MSSVNENAASLTETEAATTPTTPAADPSQNTNNSASSGADVIDARNSAIEEGEEEEAGTEEGEEDANQERVFFAQNPADLLSEEEKSQIQCIFNEMDSEKEGILRPKQLAAALKRVGVETDEDTLRRQLMMTEGDDEGIDLDDFIQLMAIHMKRMLTAADVQLAFSSFDLNNDGFIDKEELTHAMSHIGFHMEPEEIDEMIRDADKDGDGKISFEEFREKMVLCDGPGSKDGPGSGSGAVEDDGEDAKPSTAE